MDIWGADPVGVFVGSVSNVGVGGGDSVDDGPSMD